LADLLAIAAPIGLFLGRLTNFINGELWGRPTDLPWGMIFPHVDSTLRHPSQLYEAGLEGITLFCILWILLCSRKNQERRGIFSGAFLMCYGIFRFLVEYTREPDAELIWILTRGQFYSLPMIFIGFWLIIRAFKEQNKRTDVHIDSHGIR